MSVRTDGERPARAHALAAESESVGFCSKAMASAPINGSADQSISHAMFSPTEAGYGSHDEGRQTSPRSASYFVMQGSMPMVNAKLAISRINP